MTRQSRKDKFSQHQVRRKREGILAAASKLASEPGGWSSLTRAGIAYEACCSPALVSHYCGSMAAVHRLLVKSAIKQENYDLLIQAVAAGHPETLKIRSKILSQLSAGV